MANGNYPAGTTATYAPPFGYYLSTLELLTTTTCGNDGLWSVPPPDCIREVVSASSKIMIANMSF